MSTPSGGGWGTAVSGPNMGQVAWLESRGVLGPFRFLDGGFRTDVFQSSAGFIVRIGKSPAYGNTFSTEKQMMDALRTRVEVEIPRPAHAEDSLPEFPHGVMVYPKLAGASPTWPSRALARSAASALRQLHAMETGGVVPGRLVDHDAVAALRTSTRSCLTEAQRHAMDRWQADLGGFLAGKPSRCLIHGDFWHANWLCTKDGRTITGLLDFERCGIGHLHEDLAPLRYLGETFRAAVLEAYCAGNTRDPASLLEEVQMFDVLRELRGA